MDDVASLKAEVAQLRNRLAEKEREVAMLSDTLKQDAEIWVQLLDALSRMNADFRLLKRTSVIANDQAKNK
ncbi:hypothetical protein [Reyranella massiliensis]|uniref:hypothetical protein n=1 Tax=Reyranella massiliensis TaxID=445220 RepID=UPI0011D2B99A|nr:hypothetical protein [Reyranella massiliensis]